MLLLNNRRITALTPMEIHGPVRGSDFVRTLYSPKGTMTRGTLNNCAHGVTPWNTYMMSEENWAGYFRNGGDNPREHSRYGVNNRADGTGRYAWELAQSGEDQYVRFDASIKAESATGDYRNEPNCFGWMVEVDPFDPESVPKKRTALGRFAHEGVVFAPAVEGKPVVCYSGDDSTFQYIYKYVSRDNFFASTANGSLLDTGTLYVARFNADGSGDWLPLIYGQNGLTDANGFSSQADVLVNTRLAADTVGATPMDRPEWGAVDPNNGDLYFTLTNNSRRTEDNIDAANPVTGEVRRFLTGPVGQEITGCISTPDQRTLFINVQHPGATTTADEWANGLLRSTWPFGSVPPRSATVVIWKEDGGVVGT